MTSEIAAEVARINGNKRMKRIGEAARAVATLTVYEQYQRLAQLTDFSLGDTNFENWRTNPDEVTIIPVLQE